MSNKNICKFSPLAFSDTLTVPRFVQETDPAVMQVEATESMHRLLLCTKGTGTVHLDGTPYSIRNGTLLFCFCKERFCAVPDGTLTYLYLHFDGSRAQELLHRFGISKTNRLFDGMDGLIPLWQESLSRASEKTIDLAAESMLLYTFSRLFPASSHDALIDRIVGITEEAFTDPALSLLSIAKELSYHPKYLSHLFKKKMGVGYTEYLCAPRIKYAVALFDRGIESVKNVAMLSGFPDPLYFSAVFKKKIGVSPSEYKKGKGDTV